MLPQLKDGARVERAKLFKDQMLANLIPKFAGQITLTKDLTVDAILALVSYAYHLLQTVCAGMRKGNDEKMWVTSPSGYLSSLRRLG